MVAPRRRSATRWPPAMVPRITQLCAFAQSSCDPRRRAAKVAVGPQSRRLADGGRSTPQSGGPGAGWDTPSVTHKWRVWRPV